MRERPRYVLDASVAAKWHLMDEEYQEEALALLTEYQEGRVLLLAPDHIRYEVANALRIAVRRNRLNAVQGRSALLQFLDWRIPTANADALIHSAFDVSVLLGCALYDGLYLALAQASNCPLIYADGTLRNIIAARFPLALWIGDFQASGPD
jgi:predicted nucleic acid-binding protein